MWNFKSKIFGKNWKKVCQKLGMILENKGCQKLMLSKKYFVKNCASKQLLFLIKKIPKKFGWFLRLKINFEGQSSDFGTVWRTVIHCIRKINTMISFQYVDFWPKIFLFRTHQLWNYTTEISLNYTYIIEIARALN